MSQIRRIALISTLLFYLIHCCYVCKTSGIDSIHNLYFHQKCHQNAGQNRDNYMYYFYIHIYISTIFPLDMHYFYYMTVMSTAENRDSCIKLQESAGCYQTAHASMHHNIC